MANKTTASVKKGPEKEIIIPLNDHTFNKIEKEKKLLYLDIPEGLLGIYLDDE